MNTPVSVHPMLPKNLFVGAIATAVVCWIVAFLSNASESKLIVLSYLLVPLLAFGIAGLATGRRLKLALVWAGAALAALFTFMVLIFPSL